MNKVALGTSWLVTMLELNKRIGNNGGTEIFINNLILLLNVFSPLVDHYVIQANINRRLKRVKQ